MSNGIENVIGNVQTKDFPIDFSGIVNWGGRIVSTIGDFVEGAASKVLAAVTWVWARARPVLESVWNTVSPYVMSPVGVGVGAGAAAGFSAYYALNSDNAAWKRVAAGGIAVVAAALAIEAFMNPSSILPV